MGLFARCLMAAVLAGAALPVFADHVPVPPDQVFRSSFIRSSAGFQLVPPPPTYVLNLLASVPSSPVE